MSSEDERRTGEAQVEPNRAYRVFVEQMGNVKAFLYLYPNAEMGMRENLAAAIQSMRDVGGSAIGMVTDSASTTSFEAVTISSMELDSLQGNFDSFTQQVYRRHYAEIHRVFVTYLVDLYADICRANQNVLKGVDAKMSFREILDGSELGIVEALIKKQQLGLGHKDLQTIKDTFEKMGLDLSSDAESERRLTRLSASRNIIEHNNSVVNALFLRRCPDEQLEEGQELRVSLLDVSRAIALTSWLAAEFNRRACDKFPSIRAGQSGA